jgi:hypothetical protein
MSVIDKLNEYLESENKIIKFRNEVQLTIKQLESDKEVSFNEFKQSVFAMVKDLYLYLPIFVITESELQIKLANGKIDIKLTQLQIHIEYRNKPKKNDVIFYVEKQILLNRKTDVNVIEENITTCINQIIKVDSFSGELK